MSQTPLERDSPLPNDDSDLICHVRRFRSIKDRAAPIASVQGRRRVHHEIVIADC
jgi:hypothetical protein